jgi:ribonucleotide reductase alpha subunit
LQEKLSKLGIWNDKMSNLLIEHRGSIQNIKGIPKHIKEVFRTVWEISQRSVIEMAADRGQYICQSQSMNLHIEEASRGKLTSAHFLSWKLGLKTACYYLRTRPAVKALQFTVKTKRQKIMEIKAEECESCSA